MELLLRTPTTAQVARPTLPAKRLRVAAGQKIKHQSTSFFPSRKQKGKKPAPKVSNPTPQEAASRILTLSASAEGTSPQLLPPPSTQQLLGIFSQASSQTESKKKRKLSVPTERCVLFFSICKLA